MLALIRLDPEEIVSTFSEAARRIDLPGVEGGAVLSPPEAGWEGFGFRIAAVTPADPVPEGKQEVGRTDVLVDGVPIEVLTLEDIPPAPPPDRVSSRQFKLQLAIDGLKSSVDAWVAAQDELTQIAYEYSGEFVRDEPMMQAGFAALGFTTEQIDAFFTAADKL